jgi:hypothetical protein
MYESRGQRPLTRRQFARRLLQHGQIAALLIAVSLGIGTAGYMLSGGLSFVDAFLNACMLLGGMGPVGELRGTPVKLFAAFFALYSGLAFLVVAGILLAPVIHRVLHRFHFEAGRDKDA